MKLRVGDQVANVIDAGVRCRVDLDDIDVIPSRDRETRLAFPARLGGGALAALAVQRLREDARRRRLPRPARPAKQIRVRDASRLDRLLQRLRDMTLSDDFVE